MPIRNRTTQNLIRDIAERGGRHVPVLLLDPTTTELREALADGTIVREGDRVSLTEAGELVSRELSRRALNAEPAALATITELTGHTTVHALVDAVTALPAGEHWARTLRDGIEDHRVAARHFAASIAGIAHDADRYNRMAARPAHQQFASIGSTHTAYTEGNRERLEMAARALTRLLGTLGTLLHEAGLTGRPSSAEPAALPATTDYVFVEAGDLFHRLERKGPNQYFGASCADIDRHVVEPEADVRARGGRPCPACYPDQSERSAAEDPATLREYDVRVRRTETFAGRITAASLDAAGQAALDDVDQHGGRAPGLMGRINHDEDQAVATEVIST